MTCFDDLVGAFQLSPLPGDYLFDGVPAQTAEDVGLLHLVVVLRQRDRVGRQLDWPGGRHGHHPLPVRPPDVPPDAVDNVLGEWNRKTSLRRRPELAGGVEPALRCSHSFWPERVDVDDLVYFFVHAVRHSSRHLPGKTVPSQDEIVEVVVLDHIQDVLDGGLHADILRGEMDPFTHASQSDRVGRMTFLLEEGSHFLPGPCPQPCAGNKYETSHRDL